MTRRLWPALQLALALAGCDAVDIPLADPLPSLPDGGRPKRMTPCFNEGHCAPNEFCDKPSCDASSGRCLPRPSMCSPAFQPVCGCNGVTYWNDCLRRERRIEARVDGECSGSGAMTCAGSPAACPDPEASCALLLPPTSDCTSQAVGACWVVPTTCQPPMPGSSGWSSCDGPPICTSQCAAIRSGLRHLRVNTCP